MDGLQRLQADEVKAQEECNMRRLSQEEPKMDSEVEQLPRKQLSNLSQVIEIENWKFFWGVWMNFDSDFSVLNENCSYSIEID